MTDWTQEYFERGYAQRWSLAGPSDDTRREVVYLWDQLDLQANGWVVDIGCGHGKYASALAQHGARVVGVDLASTLLDRAQRLAADVGRMTLWVRGDMRLLPLGCSYFCAALLLDAFGFFELDEENESVLSEIGRVLVPGGRVALKVVNADPILAAFRTSDREDRDGTIVEVVRTLTLEPTRLRERIMMSGRGGSACYERRQRLYRAPEVCDALERSRLSVTRLSANFAGEAFDPAVSPAMVIIAERRGAA